MSLTLNRIIVIILQITVRLTFSLSNIVPPIYHTLSNYNLTLTLKRPISNFNRRKNYKQNHLVMRDLREIRWGWKFALTPRVEMWKCSSLVIKSTSCATAKDLTMGETVALRAPSQLFMTGDLQTCSYAKTAFICKIDFKTCIIFLKTNMDVLCGECVRKVAVPHSRNN